MGEVLRRALAALLLGACAQGTSAAGTVVRLSFETKENPPRYLGEGTAIPSERPGITIELMRLVEKRAGVRFELQRVPWARSLYLLETNQVDGVFHMSYVPERTRFAAYPMKDGQPDRARSIFTQSYYLYARRGTRLAWDGQRLTADGPIGTTRGYSVAKRLEELGARVEQENDLPGSMRKVLAGRLEAYAELENMAAALIARQPDEMRDIVKLQPALRQEPYYLVLSKDFQAREPALAERIWDAVGELVRSPEFREIEKRYGVTR
jgi:polar amino acid transport system substrate-binding protein